MPHRACDFPRVAIRDAAKAARKSRHYTDVDGSAKSDDSVAATRRAALECPAPRV
jgi:hypothetical protein